MKDTIQIALLAIIAATLIFIAIDLREGSPAMNTNFPASTSRFNTASSPASATKPIEPMIANTPVVAPPPENNLPTTTIAFATPQHDFGRVPQNSDNTYVFSFTNTGSRPLVITNAEGSCGCTAPTYSKHPIAPGEKGEVSVVYKPGTQQGNQNKSVTVTANTEPPQTVLYIKADVRKVD